MELLIDVKNTLLAEIKRAVSSGDTVDDRSQGAHETTHGEWPPPVYPRSSTDDVLEEAENAFNRLQNSSDGAKQKSTGSLVPSTEEVTSRASVISATSSRRTFLTGTSLLSNRSYYSAKSGSGWRRKDAKMELKEIDEYAQLLQSKKLWPVDPLIEENWSGRGQHAKFELYERKMLDEILEIRETLGSTSSAIVQSVKCRRVLLARKSIQCRRSVKKAWVLEEVAHLTRLSHSHVVRVVGTYTIGKELSILIYPVAEYNLQSFLETINTAETNKMSRSKMVRSCLQFFTCLSSAVRYIHENLTKHMDIKPPNILVRKIREANIPRLGEYKVYVADFGIAKAYQNVTAAETEGPTSFTRKYASPEVTNQELRGFAADIFSLGCVFLEMLVTIVDGHAVISRIGSELQVYASHISTVHRLQELLKNNTDRDTSYQANLVAIYDFIDKLSFRGLGSDAEILVMCRVRNLLPKMLHERPLYRPIADYITSYLGGICHHGGGCEPFALPVDISADETFYDETSDGETLNEGTSEKKN